MGYARGLRPAGLRPVLPHRTVTVIWDEPWPQKNSGTYGVRVARPPLFEPPFSTLYFVK